jgi:Polysaccharide lyase 14
MNFSQDKTIVFNVAAGVMAVVAVAAAVRSFLFTPAVAPCSERYANGNIFAFDRAGVLLTTTDLQARLGGRDVGLGDNIEIARVKGAPAPVAMAIKMAKGSASPHATAAVAGGVSFPWDPRSAQGKTAACLAYNVLLPADFEFNNGGVLPGIHGANPNDETRDNFAEQIAWKRAGRGGVLNKATIAGETRMGYAEPEPFMMPTGQWVRLEQEVVLNTTGQSDGILRVWVDGRLAIDRDDFLYRGRPGVTISGVSANVYYGNEDPDTAAPKDTTVWLSPFEIRWQ